MGRLIKIEKCKDNESEKMKGTKTRKWYFERK
jgi:hypothetical protein